MIELSEKMILSLEEAKGNGVDESLTNLKHINELKRSPHFQWFLDLVLKEIQELESRILSPRIVKDEDMPLERLKLSEWRKFLDLIHKKEQSIRNFLDRGKKS